MIGLVGVALLSAACGPFGVMTPSMTAEQMKEAAKVKDANFMCFSGLYAGAKVHSVVVNTDKGVPMAVQTDEECKKITIMSTTDNK